MTLSDNDMLESLSQDQEAEPNTQAETLTLSLPAPISVGEKTITELKLREPTLYETIIASRKVVSFPNIVRVEVMEAEIEIVRQVTGLSDAFFSQIPSGIIKKARDFVVGFEERARDNLSQEEHDLPCEKTLTFSPAIHGGGKEWDVMTLRAPTIGEIKSARMILKKASLEKIHRSNEMLITAVSGWPKAAVLRLPISNFVEASGYLNGFFPVFQ
ncbi:hypothetical protein GS535_03630 [Saccharibacter sp. EH611]|uniref:phage tail assembly protein n=1 Tax=unclassified Saccharibacter TaxID=2648722 RepID=UPI00132C0196|nr:MULTISPECIES: phage tail assembly protein [unclassified Saccharibacter]MXV35648.1 hypothetical protein [Saccharibacter sp. EH611]MXV65740.1 hypothetical protein [Saccharibacter sp. EH60]